MQTELDAMTLPVEIQILGVNGAGLEGSNANACRGKDLPWLQETSVQMVWSSWQVNYRDVIIVNENNEYLSTYNLTDRDLGNADNFNQLKTILTGYAGGQ